ncbi:MAG: AzlC family ABC transporter permease [Bacillota bacterium]
MRDDNVVMAGIKSSFPILLGYLPIGVAYGLLAVKSGLNLIETTSMSIFVFAGSAQLICVNMIGAGTTVFPIISMTFLVNLRHILMSASLSLNFRKTPSKYLPFLGFIITDESFAVGKTYFDNYDRKGLFFLSLGITAYLGWVFSSIFGALLGSLFPITDLPGLDFVLPAMFIVLLIMQMDNRKEIFVAIISAVFSLIFIYILPDNWNIITATILAATIGVFLEREGQY